MLQVSPGSYSSKVPYTIYSSSAQGGDSSCKVYNVFTIERFSFSSHIPPAWWHITERSQLKLHYYSESFIDLFTKLPRLDGYGAVQESTTLGLDGHVKSVFHRKQAPWAICCSSAKHLEGLTMGSCSPAAIGLRTSILWARTLAQILGSSTSSFAQHHFAS